MSKSMTERRLAAAGQPLGKELVAVDPVDQFASWFQQAADVELFQHNAMALATAAADGSPSARMVMLEAFDQQGFVFYTSVSSRKAAELAVNPWAALVFNWGPLYRQVRVEGAVFRLDDEACRAYFSQRPRDHQLQFYASVQGEPVGSRQELAQRRKQIEARFGTGPILHTPEFGGYRVVPHMIDFWQARQDWLHDWLRYQRQPDGSWSLERLSP